MPSIAIRLRETTERVMSLLAGPIVLKEIRGTFRTKRFFLAQLIPMLLIGAVIMGVAVVNSFVEAAHTNPEYVGKIIFGVFFVGQSILLLLVTPAFCCTAITEEREQRTFDLLITSCLSPGEIIWGKLLASLSYVFVFLLSSMPLVFISFLFGGVSPGMLAVCYIMLLVQGVVVTMFSIFSSTLVRGSKMATVLAYVPVIGGGIVLVLFEIWLAVEMSQTGLWVILSEFAGIGAFNQAMMLVSVLFLIISLCVFLFLLAVNRIRPATGNSSTSLRIFSIVFLTGVMMIYLGFMLGNMSDMDGTDVMEAMVGYYIMMPILLLFHTMAFTCERLPQSMRLRMKMKWLKGAWFPLRILGVGGISGSMFNLAMSAFLLVIPALVALVMLDGLDGAIRWYAGSEALPTMAVATAVFFYFLSMLGLLMSSLKIRPAAGRCVIFFLVTMLAFGPFFHVLYLDAIDTREEVRPTVLSCHYISPIISWISIWTPPRYDPFNSDQMLRLHYNGTPLIELSYAHIAFYGFFGTVLAGINYVIAPKSKRRQEAGG